MYSLDIRSLKLIGFVAQNATHMWIYLELGMVQAIRSETWGSNMIRASILALATLGAVSSR